MITLKYLWVSLTFVAQKKKGKNGPDCHLTFLKSIPQLPNAEPLINDVEHSPSPHDSHEPINPSSLDRPKQALGLHIDSTRFLIGDDNAGMESDAEVEEASLCGDWEDEGLQESMFKLALDEGDDMSDEDWLPYQLRKLTS